MATQENKLVQISPSYVLRVNQPTMHADQLVPAVVAAVAMVCLLIAGRADGLEEYAPAAAVSYEMEPLAMNQNPGQFRPGLAAAYGPTAAVSVEMEPLALNQNPGQFLPRPEVMPLPNELFARAEEGGDSEEYVPQVEVVPEEEVVVQPEPGDALAEAITGGAYEQPTTEPITSARDQGDFYRTPSPAEPPAKPSSPYQKKGR
uniref:Uncharacterized protein n=1 Tax=Hordeum vulgare subsp. vulgare TaxID=112509 RepID=A0A8I6Y4E7_HORVV